MTATQAADRILAEVDRALAKPKRKRRDVCGHPRVDRMRLEPDKFAIWCAEPACRHSWIEVVEP